MSEPFKYKLPGTRTVLIGVEQTGSALPNYFIGQGLHPYLDNWNQQRSKNKKYQDQLGSGQLELQKQNRDKTIVKQLFEGNIENTVWRKPASGAFIPEQNLIKLGESAWNNPSIVLHEYSHASRAIPQEQKIQSIMTQSPQYNNKYYDSPTEIYSRLMEARQNLNLDPNKQYNTKQIEQLKDKAASQNQSNNFWNRYETPILKQLINDVASINKIQNPLLSKFGSKLPILYNENKF